MNHTVPEGTSIQEVIDIADPGDVITIGEGTFYERLIIDTPNLKLVGTSGTIIDGSTATSGWSAASEVGSGVYKATLSVVPAAMHDASGSIWRINQDTMNGTAVYGCLADGFAYLRQPTIGKYTGNIGETVNSYWDGLTALFGNKGNITYVRYGNNFNPADRQIRAAPSGATIKITTYGVILDHLTICNGENQIWLTTVDAYDNNISDCRLYGGRRRVLIDNQAHDNSIYRCEIYSNCIGFINYIPGEWDRSSTDYTVVVKAHIYNENKFCVGRTTEDDTGIYLNGGAGNEVTLCDIHDGVVGIACFGGSQCLLTDNSIYRLSAQGIWLIEGCASADVLSNHFEDSEHHIRIQGLQRTNSRTYNIGLNTFWQPRPSSQSPKHINTSFEGVDNQTVASTAVINVYHNSFAGGGWAVDAGRVTGDTKHTIPKLMIINNLMSAYGVASSGGNAPGIFAYNWVRNNPGYPDTEEGNKFQSGERMWEDNTVPSFAIPDSSYGDTAKNGTLNVSQSFTVDSKTYQPLPGVPSSLAQFGAMAEESMAATSMLVTATINDLSPGDYLVVVQLLSTSRQVIAESTATPFSVSNGESQVSISDPIVEDV